VEAADQLAIRRLVVPAQPVEKRRIVNIRRGNQRLDPVSARSRRTVGALSKRGVERHRRSSGSPVSGIGFTPL